VGEIGLRHREQSTPRIMASGGSLLR